MSTDLHDHRPVILDDQELFYKRLRWDVLTLLVPLILLLDVQTMQVQKEEQFVLSYAAFFALLVGMRMIIGIKGRRKTYRTERRYKWAMGILGLQNFMISAAFVYMYQLQGLGHSNTALLLAVLIGLSSYVLFSFQLSRPYFLFQILSFILPLLSLPFIVPSSESWTFLAALFIVSLYFFKTIRLNGHILMSIEDKARVLKELNRLQSRGHDIHADRLVFLGEMASGIAHEINNPLTVIAGRTEISRKKIENGDFKPEELLSVFDIIMNQTKRAAKVVSSLKKFASVSSNEKLENESLNMIVAESLDLCFEKFRKAGIKIHVELEYQGLVECRTNEISQVILSLLNNAYEELISKKAGDIYVNSKKVDEWLELSISDNGGGIPVDQIQRVFLPFFSTKAENKGIGLGLAVARGVVESHGGQLIYERIDGRSYFVFILPLSKQVKNSEFPQYFQEKMKNFEEMLYQYEWKITNIDSLGLTRG